MMLITYNVKSISDEDILKFISSIKTKQNTLLCILDSRGGPTREFESVEPLTIRHISIGKEASLSNQEITREILYQLPQEYNLWCALDETFVFTRSIDDLIETNNPNVGIIYTDYSIELPNSSIVVINTNPPKIQHLPLMIVKRFNQSLEQEVQKLKIKYLDFVAGQLVTKHIPVPYGKIKYE